MMIPRQTWIVLAFALQAAAFPQETAKSKIVVQVVDQTGARIPQALIEVSTPAGGSLFSTKADAEGKADFNLPVGDFALVVRMQAFCPQKRSLKIVGRPLETITTELRVDSCPGRCQAGCVTVISDQVSTDRPKQRTLTVEVKDRSGALIPGAIVVVRTEKNTPFIEMRTDPLGKAVLPVDPGKYVAFVTERGFMSFSQNVDLTSASDQSIVAVLSVGQSCSGGCPVSSTAEEIEFQHPVPARTIPALALEMLTLPEHKLRMHRRNL
jgi:hypothetical protein